MFLTYTPYTNPRTTSRSLYRWLDNALSDAIQPTREASIIHTRASQDEINITIDALGIDPNSIDIRLKDNKLHVLMNGQRYIEYLPLPVNAETLTATSRFGQVFITAKVKKISVDEGIPIPIQLEESKQDMLPEPV